MKRELLLITHWFFPERVGGASRLTDLAKGLSKWYNVTVLCPSPSFPYGFFKIDNRFISKEKIGNINVVRLWTYQPQKNPSNVQRVLNYIIFPFLASFWCIVNGRKYNVIFTTTPTTFVGLCGFIVKSLYKKIWILDVRDPWLENAVRLNYIKGDTLTFRITNFIENLNWTKPDMITFLSETLKEKIMSKYSKEINAMVFPHSIDVNFFKPRKVKRKNEIVYTGNIGTGQSLEEFIKAMKYVTKRYDVKLKLVGEGENLSELEALAKRLGISRNIEFFGPVPREKIPEIISSSMISIIPLKQNIGLDYAIPIKLLETMSCETPFISTKMKEMEKIAEASKAGIVVNNNPKEIAEAIIKLIKNSSLRRKMGKNGRKYIINNFILEKNVKCLHDRINKINRT
jgi:glycosyltransferase involved in cell wall biosynthesis